MAIRWIRVRTAGLPAAGALLFAVAAGAHHAATFFDRGKPIVVSGVVREFRWTSPHAWIFLDVPAAPAAAVPAPAAAGPVQAAAAGQWAFEAASITVMVRNGWKSSSLRPGDHITVVAAPRRDGTRTGELLSVTLADSGKVLQLAGQ
jgi:hypothetical protein